MEVSEVIFMNELKFIRNSLEWIISDGQEPVLVIRTPESCEDKFDEIEPGVWRWIRTCSSPVNEMRMEVEAQYNASYYMIPAVNYNGNGWGSSLEYRGYEFDGTPWTYAWHRCAIPACTYSENERWAVALMGDAEGGMSCSLWKNEGKTSHALLWPEQEGPKVLTKRYWEPAYMGSMEAQKEFSAILMIMPVNKRREQMNFMMDMAWRNFADEFELPMQPEQIWKLDIAYAKLLWTKEPDGFVGFCIGMNWDQKAFNFVKRASGKYEIGWVGQNASLAVSLMYEYLRSGDKDALDKGLAVLDSWAKYARLDNGLMYTLLDCKPTNLESMVNGDINVNRLDACNLGTAASQYFEAARVAELCGVARPEYNEIALGLCDFAVQAQDKDGSYAKSWRRDGSVSSKDGTIGSFFIPPLIEAYKHTGKKCYLESACRAFKFYYEKFDQTGYTTAGALDSYCIDKESSGPFLRAALLLYNITEEDNYLKYAENIAYYLSTWQWHYSTKFPEDSMLAQLNYNTLGGTAVSTAHNAMDPWALYYVEALLELASLTGNKMWSHRAKAIWCNGTQLISDGTLCIRGKVRPAGSQDESVRHTRWGRPDRRIFVPSEWFVAWMGAFRMETLRHTNDWSFYREGLKEN